MSQIKGIGLLETPTLKAIRCSQLCYLKYFE